MASETAREFDIRKCPYCGAEGKSLHTLRIRSDKFSPCCLFIECDACGTVYALDRAVSWQARVVAKTKAWAV